MRSEGTSVLTKFGEPAGVFIEGQPSAEPPGGRRRPVRWALVGGHHGSGNAVDHIRPAYVKARTVSDVVATRQQDAGVVASVRSGRPRPIGEDRAEL